MKKIIKLLSILLVICTLAGCQNGDAKPKKNIEIEDMRAISELATVECYFHNVAKSEQFLDNAWYDFWHKDSIRFWIEYDGIVSIGIDADKLNIEVSKDNVVTIDLPQPIVLNAKVNPDSLTKDKFYYDSKSEMPNAIDETEVFVQAQKNMVDSASSNTALMNNARENAKELLKNYVNTVGEATGVSYIIEWNYLDAKK